jgi:hypothetical protein
MAWALTYHFCSGSRRPLERDTVIVHAFFMPEKEKLRIEVIALSETLNNNIAEAEKLMSRQKNKI